MKSLVFAGRNRKELSRDPVSFAFMLALPVLLLVMMSVMGRNIQGAGEANPAIFRIESFAPGMMVFSLSFITMFSGTLIASDRTSSFLARTFTSPLTAADFIAGYTLPLLLAALLQGVVCLAAAVALGLPVNGGIPLALLAMLPLSLLFVATGILLGSLVGPKAVSGISSMLVQVATLLGGTWFDLALLGNTVRSIGYALPYAHAVDALRAALSGNLAAAGPHLLWVLLYTLALFTLAVFAFRRNMKN